MKRAEGWNQVIRFDDIKPLKATGLSPQQHAERMVCTFVNEFIDIFNTQPLSTRLACVAKLAAMVSFLSLAAVAANLRKLPYVEPNRFPAQTGRDLWPVYNFHENWHK